MHCYLALMQTMMSFDRLCAILRRNYQNAVENVHNVAVDEGDYSYQPDAETKRKWEYVFKDLIPVQYIPSKPHPNCLEVFKECTKTTSGLPYMIDFQPRLNKDHNISGQEAVKLFFGEMVM